MPNDKWIQMWGWVFVIFVVGLLLYLTPMFAFVWCWLKSGHFGERYDFFATAVRVLKGDQVGAYDLIKAICGILAGGTLAGSSHVRKAGKTGKTFLPVWLGLIVLIFGVLGSYGVEVLVSASHDRIIPQYGVEAYNAFFNQAVSSTRESIAMAMILFGFAGGQKLA